MEVMDIAACTDRHFVMPTGVMMQSVCVNNPEVGIVFHIIVNDDVTDGDKCDLEDVTAPYSEKSVVFYRASEFIKNIDFPALENSPLTEATYYRLWLAEMLPKEIEKVLYLDGDVIIRHDLLPLWNTDIEDYAVAAVSDFSEGMIDIYNRLHYPCHLGYFNAGVLLVNLEYWRDHAVLDEFLCFMKKYPERIHWHDQDVLNFVFCEKKKKLPLKYNFQNGFMYRVPRFDYWKYEKEIKEACKDPIIVHFMGKKPFEAYQRDPHPLRSTFFKYQDQTKWKGIRCDRRPMKRKIINCIADLLRRYKLKSQIQSIYANISPIE